jgi:subtilisin family serine protease
MVELRDPPAAAVYGAQMQGNGVTVTSAAATAAAQAQLATITTAQAALRVQLSALDTRVIFAVQRVYNGVAVFANREQQAVIAALPGVAAVHPLAPKQPTNAASVPFLGIPTLWEAGGPPEMPVGLRGEGMRIAIVDTGVDYLHRTFGGPGAGYSQNDPTRIDDIAGFPGPRVVGGYDFVGDDYNASASADGDGALPQPDPDPMDCYGHGTHVAGTAAGSGVTAARTTFNGPYDTTVDFSGLYIGPGVAPRAAIYALKIFGCYGSTTLTDLALEWTVDPNGDGDFSDRMDVVNLSLGSPYGSEYDTSVVAANNAALVGVIVVASAGNSGDIQFITSAPATADRAISVAATQRTADLGAPFSARGPRRGDAALKPDLAAPGSGIISADAGTGADRVSSSGTSMAAPHVSGLMALLRQAHPAWRVEELKALAMNTAILQVGRSTGSAAPPLLPVRIGAGRIDPPAAAAATALVYSADGSGRVSVSFGAPAVSGPYSAVQEVEVANKAGVTVTFALGYNSLVKLPGVAVGVPGAQLVVPPQSSVRVPITLNVDPQRYQRRQAPADRGSYLLTSWLAEEAGHLLLWPAGAAQTVQMGPVGGETQKGSEMGSAAATLAFQYTPETQMLAYTITLSGIQASAVTSATLGYGAPAEKGETLAALAVPAEGMQFAGAIVLDDKRERLLAAGLLHVQLTGAPFPAGTLRGQLRFTPPLLHLPVHAAPRLAADMHVAPQALTFYSGTVAALTLVGRGLGGTAPPTDVVSLSSVLELKLRSPNTRPSWLDSNAADRFDHADLQYVGVTSDEALGAAAAPGAARLYFGVTTWADWSTPNEVRVNVLLDTDRDGEYDFRLANGTPIAPVIGAGPVGPLIAELYDLSTGEAIAQEPLNGVSPAAYDTNAFFNNVMVLPVRIADLGPGAGTGDIAFMLQTTSLDAVAEAGSYIDRSPVLHYNPARPALTFSAPTAAAQTYLDQPRAQVAITAHGVNYPFNPPGGVLVLHHHNERGARAEVILLDYRWPAAAYLPIIGRGAP